MIDIDQDQFITQFITMFLATWTANEYAGACARGEQKRLENPPVADAIYLARVAYCSILEHGFAGSRYKKGI